MREHWHRSNSNVHLEFMKEAKWNLQKMFSVPKSKSPWEAMTAGSTGGWAKGLQPWGGAINTLLGAIPVVGPIASAIGGAAGMMGGGTGFQGTDKGWANLMPTLMGGLGGYAAGGLGRGLSTGIGNMFSGSSTPVLNKFLAGFGGGIKDYLGTNIIPGLQGSSGFGIAKGIGGLLGGGGGQGGGAGSWLSNLTGKSELLGAMGGSSSPFNLNLGNVAGATLGGVGGLLGMFGMGGGSGMPRLEGRREEALSKVYTPALTEARGMLRDLALKNPAELYGPASDEFIEASLRQSREAAARTKAETLNTFAATSEGSSGKVAGKSGSVERYLKETDKAQVQRETDFITSMNEARRLAAVNLKVKAVADYYGMALEEAANLLAAEGYVNPIDAQNYMAAMSNFNMQNRMSMLSSLM